jgi:hypothetical protein
VLAPVWWIAFASILAEVVAELIDTEACGVGAAVRQVPPVGESARFERCGCAGAHRDLRRVAFSGTVGAGEIGELFVTDAAVKGAVTVLSIPWIYLVRSRGPDQPPASGESRP